MAQIDIEFNQEDLNKLLTISEQFLENIKQATDSLSKTTGIKATVDDMAKLEKIQADLITQQEKINQAKQKSAILAEQQRQQEQKTNQQILKTRKEEESLVIARSRAVAAQKKEMDAAEKAAQSAKKQLDWRETVNLTNKSLMMLRQEIKGINQAMSEAAKSGNTQEFERLKQVLTKSKEQMQDLREATIPLDNQIKYLSGNIGGLVGIGTNLATVFGATSQSAEELFKTFAVAQSISGVFSGIADLTEMWGRTPVALMAVAKMLGIVTVSTEAAAVASEADAVAKGTETVATEAATVATWELNAAFLASPIGMIVLAVIGLGAALYQVVTAIDGADLAQQAYNKTMADSLDKASKTLEQEIKLAEIHGESEVKLKRMALAQAFVNAELAKYNYLLDDSDENAQKLQDAVNEYELALERAKVENVKASGAVEMLTGAIKTNSKEYKDNTKSTKDNTKAKEEHLQKMELLTLSTTQQAKMQAFANDMWDWVKKNMPQVTGEIEKLNEAMDDNIKKIPEQANELKNNNIREHWKKVFEGVDGKSVGIDKAKRTLGNDLKTFWQEIGAGAGMDEALKVGFGLNDKQVESLKGTFNDVLSSYQNFIGAKIELAQADVDQATTRIDELNQQLQAEELLNQQGYSSNIQATLANIAAEDQIRKKALEDKKRYAQQQMAIDIAMQVASTVTAVANTFKTWSEVPFVGYILAGVQVAGLLASIAAAKSKAQATAKFAKGKVRIGLPSGVPDGVDTIPAMISRGESVINDEATDRYYNTLEAINAMGSPERVIAATMKDARRGGRGDRLLEAIERNTRARGENSVRYENGYRIEVVGNKTRYLKVA